MEKQNIFEYATRNKLRFATVRGIIDTEGLWDVPLRSRDSFDLNTIARSIKKNLVAASEENFVDTDQGKTPEQTRSEVAFAVVMSIIESKKEDEAAQERRAKNKALREQLMAALAEKQAGKLSSMSERELLKKLEQLGDE